MADHAPLLTSENYATLLTSRISGRLDDLSRNFDPAYTSASNVPTNTIRWNSALNRDEKWNGTSWVEKSTNYAINISGNAGTVSNGLYSTVSYANPVWLVSLGSSKLTGNIPESLLVHVAAGAGAVPRTVQTKLRETVSVKDYGAVGDGVTEDTNAIQACIDDNKGKNILFPSGYTYLAQGVILSGAAYNGTSLDIQGEFVLKPSLTLGGNNFQSVWCGFAFHLVDRCTIRGNFNGNRTAQQDREQTHCVVLAGVSNFYAPDTRFREIRGDGFYLSQSDLTASSVNPTNVTFGFLQGINSVEDGRNLLSIIAGYNITVSDFKSIGIGGIVGGVRQPGGLDIEPNFMYQIVDGVHVASAYIRSAGSGCFGVIGKDDGAENYNISNVSVGWVDSLNTNTAASDGHYAVLITGCVNLTLRGVAGTASVNFGSGLLVDRCKQGVVDVAVCRAKYGALIGYSGWVRKSNINVIVSAYSAVGIRTIGVSDSSIGGSVCGATSSSNTFAVQTRNLSRGITQTNVKYAVDCPYDGLNARGYRNEPTDLMVFASCILSNCDVSKYPSFVVGIDGMTGGMEWNNITGYSTATAQPANGSWPAGFFVRRSAPAKDGNNMSIFGWHRATTGSAHVAETDWFTARVSLVSPAI
jgi:hypothetical protein